MTNQWIGAAEVVRLVKRTRQGVYDLMDSGKLGEVLIDSGVRMVCLDAVVDYKDHEETKRTKYMKIQQVCAKLGLSRLAVERFIASGTIADYVREWNGRVYVSLEDVERLDAKLAETHAKEQMFIDAKNGTLLTKTKTLTTEQFSRYLWVVRGGTPGQELDEAVQALVIDGCYTREELDKMSGGGVGGNSQPPLPWQAEFDVWKANHPEREDEWFSIEDRLVSGELCVEDLGE